MAHRKNYMPLPDGEFVVWAKTKSESRGRKHVINLIVRNLPVAALKTVLKTVA
ncbi:MAG: hypothetical protein LBG58_00785 [Planctomycetaceae bacterium]|jgi:hypothetical protein|nr:hypothetical protein [Planctomycetaceae bacterium]